MAALVIAAIAPYVATLTFDFILDDRLIVRQNEAIRGWDALLTLWGQPYWVPAAGEAGQGLYRPVFMVVLSVLWNAGLRFPIFFHLLAVAAHAVATVLVFRVLRPSVTTPGAAVGALWFAVHPVHLEAVASVANSSEVLVTVATLAVALVLLRANGGLGTGAIGWPTAILAGALFAAAVLTKESGVTVPALALLAVWGRRAVTRPDVPWRTSVRDALYRWWRVAVSCAAVLVAVIVARVVVLQSLVSSQSIAAEGLDALSAWQRMWAMLSLGPKVVELLLWPGELNPMYGPRALAGNTGPNIPATVFLMALALAAWGAWRMAQRGDRRVACAIAWTLIAFAPASNLFVPTGQILAERTLYLSSVGVAMLLAVGVDAALGSLDRVSASMRRVLQAGAATAVVVLTVLGVRSTSHRSQAWKDHGALFSQAIKADSGDFRPYWHLAKYRLTTGENEPALAAYARAFDLASSERDLLMDYSSVLLKIGQPAQAAGVAGRLMTFPEARRDPVAVAVYLEGMGMGFGADSMLAAGRRLYADAPLPTTAFYLGSALEARRQPAAAIEMYRRGLAGAPADTAGIRRVRERLLALGRK